MADEEDECDSSSLFTVASQSDVASFLQLQAAKISTGTANINDEDDSSMDGSLLARFAQTVPPPPTKMLINNASIRSTPVKPYLSRSCFASLSGVSPSKTTPQKGFAADDLTELKWLNTFKLKELKDNSTNESKEKETDPSQTQPTSQNEQQPNNDEDRLAKLISELRACDNRNEESTKKNFTSVGVFLFVALFTKRDDKQAPWSSTIRQLYDYALANDKQMTSRRGWKNALRQTLITIPCFAKTKRDILKSRSVWTIDPYYRPLLSKAYLSAPPLLPPTTPNKTLSEAPTNRHDNDKSPLRTSSNDQADTDRSSQSILCNFAPKATVKTKALFPRLYERFCEEKPEDDEADSNNNNVNTHRTPTKGRKRPRTTSSSGHRRSKNKDVNRSSLSSSWTAKLLKRHKRRHQRQFDLEPKTSTPNRGGSLSMSRSHAENRSSSMSAIVTPCPSSDHNYLISVKQDQSEKFSPRKSSILERTKSTGSIEYSDPSNDEDDERDSASTMRTIRKSIITTRAQKAAARGLSTSMGGLDKRAHRRKSSPPRKRPAALLLPPHRPNTRMSRRTIEHDLKLLRQATVLPPMSPPTAPQPLDLSIGYHRSSTIENEISLTNIETTIQEMTTPITSVPMDGVLDLSLSR